MKKSRAYEFSQPTRQSYAAILLITYRLYKILGRQLFPVLVIVLIEGKIAKSSMFIYSIIAIAVLAAIYSIAAFFKYYFYIKGQKLIVQKGVFKKSLVEIPFDRIQSINFEQNLIHRLFGVVKLNMDTAGSIGNELQLNALDRNMARSLSEIILSSRRSKAKKSNNGETDPKENNLTGIFRLTIAQLIKVGITENHIRSGGVIIFFIFYLYESFEEVGVNLIEKGEQYVPVAQQLTQSLISIAILLILFAIIAFVISIVRTILNYYDLKMYRKAGGFVIVSGLLNKKEKAAKDTKIQVIKSSQNLLQKMGGIYELMMQQASSVAVSESKSIKVVGLSAHNVRQTHKYILKDNFEMAEQMPLQKVNKYYLIRRLVYSAVFATAVCGICILSYRFDYLLIAALLSMLAFSGSYLSYKKKQYGISESLIKITGGVFGHTTTLIESFKIQSLELKSTIFQRRRGLASLVLNTASGSVRIPDITNEECFRLMNYLAAVVEGSKKHWM